MDRKRKQDYCYCVPHLAPPHTHPTRASESLTSERGHPGPHGSAATMAAGDQRHAPTAGQNQTFLSFQGAEQRGSKLGKRTPTAWRAATGAGTPSARVAISGNPCLCWSFSEASNSWNCERCEPFLAIRYVYDASLTTTAVNAHPGGGKGGAGSHLLTASLKTKPRGGCWRDQAQQGAASAASQPPPGTVQCHGPMQPPKAVTVPFPVGPEPSASTKHVGIFPCIPDPQFLWAGTPCTAAKRNMLLLSSFLPPPVFPSTKILMKASMRKSKLQL